MSPPPQSSSSSSSFSSSSSSSHDSLRPKRSRRRLQRKPHYFGASASAGTAQCMFVGHIFVSYRGRSIYDLAGCCPCNSLLLLLLSLFDVDDRSKHIPRLPVGKGRLISCLFTPPFSSSFPPLLLELNGVAFTSTGFPASAGASPAPIYHPLFFFLPMASE